MLVSQEGGWRDALAMSHLLFCCWDDDFVARIVAEDTTPASIIVM